MLSILKNRRNSISHTLDDEEQTSIFKAVTDSPPVGRQRRHTISSDSSPIATETKIPKSTSTPKLFSKIFKTKADNNVVDDYFNVSDDWDVPVETTSSGGVVFQVKKKLYSSPNKGEIVARQLIIDTLGISEYEPRTQQLIHVYKFEDIKAFFYSDDNNFFVIQYVNPLTLAKPENVVWKYLHQVHRIKAVVSKRVQELLEAKKANNTTNGTKTVTPSTLANNTSPQTSFDWLSDEESNPVIKKTPSTRSPATSTSDLISFE